MIQAGAVQVRFRKGHVWWTAENVCVQTIGSQNLDFFGAIFAKSEPFCIFRRPKNTTMGLNLDACFIRDHEKMAKKLLTTDLPPSVKKLGNFFFQFFCSCGPQSMIQTMNNSQKAKHCQDPNFQSLIFPRFRDICKQIQIIKY